VARYQVFFAAKSGPPSLYFTRLGYFWIDDGQAFGYSDFAEVGVGTNEIIEEDDAIQTERHCELECVQRAKASRRGEIYELLLRLLKIGWSYLHDAPQASGYIA
jgi:hypothetical protein